MDILLIHFLNILFIYRRIKNDEQAAFSTLQDAVNSHDNDRFTSRGPMSGKRIMNYPAL